MCFFRGSFEVSASCYYVKYAVLLPRYFPSVVFSPYVVRRQFYFRDDFYGSFTLVIVSEGCCTPAMYSKGCFTIYPNLFGEPFSLGMLPEGSFTPGTISVGCLLLPCFPRAVFSHNILRGQFYSCNVF